MKRYFAIFILSMIPAAAHAGAWTQEKGAAQLITTLNYSSADHIYDKRGHRQSQPTYQNLGASIYGEYGLCNAVTIGGQLAVANASQSGNNNFALLDTELFARARIWHNDQAVLSIQPYVVVPSGYHTTNVPSLGSNDYSAGLRGAYGQNYNLFGKPGYFDVAASYQYRAGNAGDQLKLDLTTELNLNSKWSVMPQVFITHSRKNIGSSTFTQSAADDYNLATLQLSTLYKLTDTTKVQLGINHAVDGKNTGAGYGVFVGYWINF